MINFYWSNSGLCRWLVLRGRDLKNYIWLVESYIKYLIFVRSATKADNLNKQISSLRVRKVRGSSRWFFLLETKIARMTLLLAIDNTILTTPSTIFFVVYSRIQWFGLLEAFTTYRCFKIVTWQKAGTTLKASQTVHLPFWFPAFEQINHLLSNTVISNTI